MLLDLRKKTTKPLQCQDCDIDVRFLASVRLKRVFHSTITKRKFFLCPNCGRLTSALVVTYQHPRSVAMSGGSMAEIKPRPHLTRHSF
jgi:ribosomal protein L44E